MKLKVFLSSRNNDNVVVKGIKGDTLTEIRKFIKTELEATKFFDKDLFEIKINEDFGAVTDTDSYNACLKEVKDSDFVIALYNGVAGWAPKGIDLGYVPRWRAFATRVGIISHPSLNPFVVRF